MKIINNIVDFFVKNRIRQRLRRNNRNIRKYFNAKK